MKVRELKEFLADYDDETDVFYQDKNNINKYVPLRGFEVQRFNGRPRLVLLTTKSLKHEFNG